jgi:hypothetical protein
MRAQSRSSTAFGFSPRKVTVDGEGNVSVRSRRILAGRIVRSAIGPKPVTLHLRRLPPAAAEDRLDRG